MSRQVSTVNIISGRNTIRQINNKSLIHFEDTRQIFVEKKKEIEGKWRWMNWDGRNQKTRIPGSKRSTLTLNNSNLPQTLNRVPETALGSRNQKTRIPGSKWSTLTMNNSNLPQTLNRVPETALSSQRTGTYFLRPPCLAGRAEEEYVRQRLHA